MKKTKCPLFIFLVIFAYLDSQEKVCSQTFVSICTYLPYNVAFTINDMEIPETKRVIPKGFELGTILS